MQAQSSKDPQAASNTSAFGLSKDVHVPLMVKLCSLQPSELSSAKKKLAKPSTKYSNPSIFSKLSDIYANSDLFVQVEVLSGTSHNPLTLRTHSLYHSFPSSKRVWNKELELPIDYNQLSIDTYLKFTLLEISHTEPVVFGVGCLSLFNTTNATLRKGLQKIGIAVSDFNKVVVEYGELSGITDIEKKLIQYENGEFNKVDWLDKMSLPKVEKKRNEQLVLEPSSSQTYMYYMYVELPNFELPVVFSDISYHIPHTRKIVDQFIANKKTLSDSNGTSIIINSVDLSQTRRTAAVKVFDAEFHVSNLHLLQNNSINGQAAISANPNSRLDPIEYKYHKLERNMNNSILLDKELKPTPQLRDELMKILSKPSNIELTDVEKNLIWKFRYYFSKNIATTSTAADNPKDVPKKETSKSSQAFLTKFLKSINWDNDYELDHAFNEIIPNYWSVDKIQIGDALELLSNYFNPRTLVTRIDAATDSKKDKNNETRLEKIFRYVHVLRNFAVDRLRLASGEELLLYLLQLVQALKYESLIVEGELSMEGNLQAAAKDSDDVLSKSPLASFLVERSVENPILGNFFYWFVKVENEDQLNTHGPQALEIYSVVLNKYIGDVKQYSDRNKLPNYNYLKRQVWFIKKLTALVELLRSTFKKNEATAKKIQFLRDYLADSSNELLKFPHAFPLPLDPSIIICGCYPGESSVFKSSLAPLKITFKTVLANKDSTQMFGKKSQKYGKYTLMFKSGDDLRQDQLVIQIIDLMDQLLKNENLDLKLTPYRILATSPIAGMIQFVENETLDAVLVKNYSLQDVNIPSAASGTNSNGNGILNYLRYHSRELQQAEPAAFSVLGTPSRAPVREQHAITSDLGTSTVVMDNYVKSCAGYCVITYLLGVGDRHLDNLLLSPNGKFWHADFGYILGRDPKPFPPLMKLPIQVIDGMGGLEHENFNIFKNYCFVTYTTLRQNSNLILNLFQLMLDASIPDIQIDPLRAVEKVQEKFCLEMTEEEAILHFQNLINDSVNAFLPVVIDRLHSLAQYWRA